ncbi:hypothetical protein F4808DRAFT_475736 [Astrocystis sublimbata]|nr:hypothetical protein F4808DRAFT_475736 [Astrocystis sublimbata]
MLPRTLTVRGRQRTYFAELDIWQHFGDERRSLYFRHYNGGSLDKLIAHHRSRGRAVPEHFIWHVLLTLIEAVRFLKFGVSPDGKEAPEGWVAIHHRKISASNIFVHYPPQAEDEPDLGFEENAFPELVLGDFGDAALQTDQDTELGRRRIYNGFWDQPGVIADWHDTYSIFATAKHLASQIPPGELSLASEINDNLGVNERPYSDELIWLLQEFEWPNIEHFPAITDQQEIEGEMVPNYAHIQNMQWVIDHWLDDVRRHVQSYRNPDVNALPDRWWRRLDVSWTIPDPFMPYDYRETVVDAPNPPEGHECPVPNPMTQRALLGPILEAADNHPERQAHVLRCVEYQRPRVSEVRVPPDLPIPGPPGLPDPPVAS